MASLIPVVTEQTQRELWDMAKIGLVSTLLGAPLGVWAHRKWPDEEWKTAAILLGFGLTVRYVGLKLLDNPGDSSVA